MTIIDNIQRMSAFSRLLKKEGKTVGFVPTMGYLHEGHLSLARMAKKQNDAVVMSIFVNPIQFGPNEDLASYPRDISRDRELAESAGVDALFYPSEKDVYPEGYGTYVNVEGLTDRMCGAKRPGHFKGVATVVAKLFGIVKPDIAYFGQKDAQQAIVIKKMAADLNMDVDIRVLPTVREKDGLAMSSRNKYLSEAERKDAVVLYKALQEAQSLIKKGERDAGKLKEAIEAVIKKSPSARIDYIAVVDAKDLKDVNVISQETLIALAVYIGKTRLIDNVIVSSR